MDRPRLGQAGFGLLLYAAAALAILGTLAGIGYSIRKAGADAVRAELQPQLTACQALTADLGDKLQAQNQAVEKLRAEGAAKAARAAQALRKAEARAATWDADAKRLRDALTSRKPEGPKDCRAAWEQIRGAK